jgi:hypothetical protein
MAPYLVCCVSKETFISNLSKGESMEMNFSAELYDLILVANEAIILFDLNIKSLTLHNM